jgi:titin
LIDFLYPLTDKPSSPNNLKVKAVTADSISLTWDAQDTDGGDTITGYIIEKKDATRTTWTTAAMLGPDVYSYTLPKLIEGNDYLLRIYAENTVGTSEPFALAESVRVKSPYGKFIDLFTLQTWAQVFKAAQAILSFTNPI